MKKIKATTRDEAEQHAKDWQQWASEQQLSYYELAEWQAHFTMLARKFNLVEDFEENGII